ncbi:MAG: hypothetical protein AB1777_12510 [Bacteroidota bacterium]
MKKIKICKIGHFNHSVDIEKLKKWNSKFFEIVSIETVDYISVDHFTDNYVYPNEKINQNIGNDENGIDVKIAVIDQPLIGDFYMHRIGEKKVVISIYRINEILNQEKIPIENFLMTNIYRIVILLYEGYSLINEDVYSLNHHETRRCVFDMNVFVERVKYSSVNPIICNECKSRLEKKTLPENFIKIIEKEIGKIRLPLYYRIENRIKKNPIRYLIATILFALFLNILANYIYDFIKPQCEKKNQIELKEKQEKPLPTTGGLAYWG